VALAVAAVLYLATYGARTPLLALRGLMRLRNLAIIVVPAAALTGVAYVAGSLEPKAYAAAIAVALAPAPLAAPELVARMRGRMDLAGALVLGTVALSLLFVGGRGPGAAAGLFTAVEAYAVPAMFANALPTVRDRLLPLLRPAGWLAFAAVVAVGIASAPAIDGTTILVALGLLIAGVVSATAVGLGTGRDITAAIAGGGLRDPALAVPLALAIGADAAIPLVYGVGVGVIAVLGLLRSR